MNKISTRGATSNAATDSLSQTGTDLSPDTFFQVASFVGTPMTTSGDAVPNWIAAINDTILQADVTSAYHSGPITEAGVAAIMTDLSAELTQSKTSLSANQFADLQAIAANLGSLGASPYVQFITNAFVNGNASNATWTGGSSRPSQLGNLTVGSNTAKLNKLIGKWFLGTDLPASTVVLGGYGYFNIRYGVPQGSLFGSASSGGAAAQSNSGPTMADINQGGIGDCYLLSSLAEVANNNSSMIESMISDNKNGTYGVRFFVNGEARYVTIDGYIATSGGRLNNGPNLWGSLIEVAYAEVQDQGVITGNTVNYGNSFSTIGNGGCVEYALEEITGAKLITDFSGVGHNWYLYQYDPTMSQIGDASMVNQNTVLSTLVADLLVGSDLVLSSYTNSRDTQGHTNLVADHGMSIYGYDTATKMFEVRNPWGVAKGQTWNTTFEVSLSTLMNAGDTITVDNVGEKPVIDAAPAVAAAGLQAMAVVTSFSISDTAANIGASINELACDSKLSFLTVSGTNSAEALDLSKLSVDASIDLGGNSGAVSLVGFSSTGVGTGRASAINYIGRHDTLSLSSGEDTVHSLLGGAAGVDFIQGFDPGIDHLLLTLNGNGIEQTIIGGNDWVSSTTDYTHGVLLLGVRSAQSWTASNGMAQIG